jgi:hypothetical protein
MALPDAEVQCRYDPAVADTITAYECVACECRGNSLETVHHLLICTDRSRTRPLTFELGGVSRRPSFGAAS